MINLKEFQHFFLPFVFFAKVSYLTLSDARNKLYASYIEKESLIPCRLIIKQKYIEKKKQYF